MSNRYDEDHWRQSMRELKDAIKTALPQKSPQRMDATKSYRPPVPSAPAAESIFPTPAGSGMRSHLHDVGFGSPSRGHEGHAAYVYIKKLRDQLKSLEQSRNAAYNELDHLQSSLVGEKQRGESLEQENIQNARRQEELLVQLNEERMRSSKLQEELEMINSTVVKAAADDVADSVRVRNNAERNTYSNMFDRFPANRSEEIRAELEAEEKLRNVQSHMTPSKADMRKVQHDLDDAFDSVKRNMLTLSQQADLAKSRAEAAKRAMNESIMREENEVKRREEAVRQSMRNQQEEAKRDAVELVSTLQHVKDQMLELEREFALVKDQEERKLADQAEALHQEKMKNSYLEIQKQTAEQKMSQLERSQKMSDARLREIEGGINEEKRLRKSLEENRKKVDETLMRSVMALNDSMLGKPKPSAPPVEADPEWLEPGKKGKKTTGKKIVKKGKKGAKKGKKAQHKQPPFVPSSHAGMSHNLSANVQKVLAVLHQHNAEHCDTCRRAAAKVVFEENQERDRTPVKSYANSSLENLYTSVRKEMDELHAQYQDLTAQSLDQTLDPADSQLIADGIDSLSHHIKEKKAQLEIVKKMYKKEHAKHTPVRPVATTPAESRIDAFHLMKHLAFSHDDDRHRLDSPTK